MSPTRIERFRKEREALNEIVFRYAGKNIKRFFNIDTHAYEDGALPKKTKEMLGLVASLVLRCDDCILYHLMRCAEEGISDGELEEVLNIGLVVGGSITIPHMRRALLAWDELKSGGAPSSLCPEHGSNPASTDIHGLLADLDAELAAHLEESDAPLGQLLHSICQSLVHRIPSFRRAAFYAPDPSTPGTLVLLAESGDHGGPGRISGTDHPVARAMSTLSPTEGPGADPVELALPVFGLSGILGAVLVAGFAQSPGDAERAFLSALCVQTGRRL